MKNSRVLAMVLCLVLALGLVTPAFAATTYAVTVSYDGTLHSKNGYTEGSRISLPLYVTGEKDVASVTITSGNYAKTISDFASATKDTLPNGTVYTLSATADADGALSITLSTTGVKESFDVAVATAATKYTVMANSGTYGKNSNYGDAGAATCAVDHASQEVAGGHSYTVTFTPNAGLEITYLNIRANYSNKSNLVNVVTSDTVTVADQVFNIDRNEETGVVAVTCNAAKHDMFISALTATASKRYTLSVSTDANLTADVTETSLTSGSVKTVSITPIGDYAVDNVEIKDGAYTGVISSQSSSVRVNGHTYTLDRDPDGSAKLYVPGMTADVAVTVNSGAGRTYLEVRGRGFTSNFSGLTYVSDNSSNTVSIRPNSGVELDYITVVSAKGSATFHADDGSFVLGGTLYRVSHEADGRILIYLNPMPGSTTITVSTYGYDYDDDYYYDDYYDGYHNVTLGADAGAAVVGQDVLTVLSGDTADVVFRPLSGYEIERIIITTDGASYSAYVDNGYVLVAGVRFPISVSSTGRVTVTVRGSNRNIYVRAVTGYTGTSTGSGSGTGTTRGLVTRLNSPHVNISVDPTTVYRGDNVTITLRPTGGYDISSIAVTCDDRTVNVRRSTTSVTVSRTSLSVSWKTNGTVILSCRSLSQALSVGATATRNGDDVYDDSYHAPYLYGVGGGMFAPEANMTRAEAVTLLTRLFSGLEDDELKGYATNSAFQDVSRTAWYAPYIVWAEDAGYLDSLYGARLFRPQEPITRAEFVDLVCAFDGGYDTEGYNLRYSDMNWAHWAARQVAYATGMGWINGYPDGTFGPEDTLTRAQVAAIISRVTGRTDTAFLHGGYLTTFLDVPATHWAYAVICEATNGHYAY